MSYLNCSRCGLSMASRRTGIEPAHCPRCLARARVAQPLFRSPLPMGRLSSPRAGSAPEPELEPVRDARRALTG